MIVVDSYKFGNILLLILDKDLPIDFINHSKLLIGDKVYFDAVIVSNNYANSRDVSINCDKEIDLLGKEVIVL